MGILLANYMCLLLYTMKSILGFCRKKENINGDSIILTCFVMPLSVFLWDIMKILTGFFNSIVANSVCGILGCFAIVFLYVWGCCSLEYHIIENQESQLQVFRNKGNGAMLLLSGCMLLSGIAGGINEYLGYWIVFLSYWIVSIVFIVPNMHRESMRNTLKRWKAEDGILLLLTKLMIVGVSIYVKTLLFMNHAQPAYGMITLLKYKWIRDIEFVLWKMLYYGGRYVFLGVIPCLFVLYIVTVLCRKKENV